MFHCLSIILDSPIERGGQQFDDLITIESIRDFILASSSTFPSVVQNTLNHQAYTMPKIIYSRPHGNSVRIFALGEDGVLALNSVFAHLSRTKQMRIKNKNYKIKSLVVDPDKDFLAQSNGLKNTYTTLTPIAIFGKKNYGVFKSIYHRAFGDNIPVRKETIQKAEPMKKEAFYGELKQFAKQFITDYIKFYTASVLGGEKNTYAFVDTLEIEWNNIDIVFAKYHSEEKAMPMVIGKFNSNLMLPKFIGYKTGKGFGELSLKEKGAAYGF